MNGDHGPKQTVLRSLVDQRLGDARALLETSVRKKQPQRRAGAVYLAGYAAECALKARLCADKKERRLPPRFFTHDLVALARQTAVWARFRSDSTARRAFIIIATTWDVSLRYQTKHPSYEEATRLLQRVKEFVKWVFAN